MFSLRDLLVSRDRKVHPKLVLRNKNLRTYRITFTCIKRVQRIEVMYPVARKIIIWISKTRSNIVRNLKLLGNGVKSLGSKMTQMDILGI